jgi:general secretion pathway protein I
MSPQVTSLVDEPPVTMAVLFVGRPARWGLRGDPPLWDALAADLAALPLPATPAECKALLEERFALLTGAPIAQREDILVPAFRHGGMSSGYVSPAFWRRTALPLLLRRHARVLAGLNTVGAPKRPRAAGFTLLELLVALAVLAIALAAVMRTVGAATRGVEALRLRTLAAWVAENRLAEHRARRDWLPIGRNEGTARQGGLQFRWREDVRATPNGQFRRIEVRVLADDGASSADVRPDSGDHALARVEGFLVAPGLGR